MRRIRIFTAAMAFSASLAASNALAQASPGWQICWGPPGQQNCSNISNEAIQAWSSTYDFDLRTPSGIVSRYCGPSDTSGNGEGNYLTVHNSTLDSLGLIINPLNGAGVTGSMPPDLCGPTLASDATCNLPCSQPTPD